ncbi:MAG TPA: hypothetical protein PLM58_13705, partial [Novosphingobium sp.]|nr:hypothetical protein [Novosphingobium sp.]
MTASLLNSLPNPENPDLEVIMQSVSYTIARPDSGAVLPYAVVTVFEQDGSTRASMFDAEGAGVGNPITADANGAVNFAAANGTYILRAVSADGLLTLPDLTVQVFDLQALANSIAAGGVAGVIDVKYATDADMRADNSKAPGTIALVYADTDPVKNDLYYKIGSIGSGPWSGSLGLLAGLSYTYAQQTLAALAAMRVPFGVEIYNGGSAILEGIYNGDYNAAANYTINRLTIVIEDATAGA